MRASRRVEKPWGHEEIWAEAAGYVGKVLFIAEGHRLSLQHHRVKHETIRVARGVLELTLDDAQGQLQVQILQVGDSTEIPPGTRHRMRAITAVEIFEVSTAELDDVVRHEDDYGRA